MEYQKWSTQHSVTTYMGKDPKINRYICICVNAQDSVHLEKKTFFNQICSDKNYNLKTQTRITEAKTYGGLSWHIPL